jgi:hypothetical protein
MDGVMAAQQRGCALPVRKANLRLCIFYLNLREKKLENFFFSSQTLTAI